MIYGDTQANAFSLIIFNAIVNDYFIVNSNSLYICNPFSILGLLSYSVIFTKTLYIYIYEDISAELIPTLYKRLILLSMLSLHRI